MNKNTAQRISHLIKEVLSTPLKKDKCNCGCHSCENVGNPGPVLNENISTKITLSENMKYHVDNKLPLTENTFRYGSEAFLNLWNEARTLYKQNAIYLNDVDKELVMETDLGKWGMYEGKKVPLDLLLMEGEKSYYIVKFGFNDDGEYKVVNSKPIYAESEEEAATLLKDQFESYEGVPCEIISVSKKLNESEVGGPEDVEFTTSVFMVPYLPLLQAIERDYGKRDLYYEVEQALFDKNLGEVIRILQRYEVDKEYAPLLNLNETKYQPIIEDINIYGKIYEEVDIKNSYKIEDINSDDVSNSFIFTDKHGIKRKLQYFKGNSIKLLWFNPSTQKWTTDDIPSKYEDEKVMNTFGMILIKVILPKYGSFNFKALNSARYRLFRALIYNNLNTLKYNMDFDDNKMEIKVTSNSLINEISKKKKTPPIGKPKRGGSKKFYVYVRKPGGGIKKVSFGMAGGGLRAKLNNPKARQAFAKRHKCAQAKDRTTARYWSCRLPRYAKLLGFKTTFSGYW